MKKNPDECRQRGGIIDIDGERSADIAGEGRRFTEAEHTRIMNLLRKKDKK